QMKATGEVMSICTNFEGALMKALRSLEQHIYDLEYPEFAAMDREELKKKLYRVDDRRIFCIAEALRRGFSYELIHEITRIDIWFIDKINKLVQMEKRLKEEELTPALLKEAKRLEYPDRVIAKLTGKSGEEVKQLRYANGIIASYKMVDTCAAEFDAETPYYYSCYDGENEADGSSDGRKKILVLGSGPIRIGQGIEFDFCSVHSVWAFREMGYETIIVNNNPETVSTDFDIADKLYFEPLTAEDVESIVRLEKPDGAVVQFGGQTAIKLTEDLMKMGVPIFGTSADDVDAAEDRERFDAILEETCIPRAAGDTVFTCEDAIEVANRLGYPVLVRPSYVLGGAGMQIAICDEDIRKFMAVINRTRQKHPILIDKYLMGREVEVDAVCDGEDILIPGIMEHVERAGVHSGDSISVYPPQNLDERMLKLITRYTRALARALHVKGLINIQFIVYHDELFVIEVNPRSSRTIPYISKVTGIPIVKLAAQVIMGKTIRELGYEPGLQPNADYIAIKMPVFSFEKLRGADIGLGPEMKSTGEVLGIARNFHEALYKAFIGAGYDLPKTKQMVITVKDSDKMEAVEVGKRFKKLGYTIFATGKTSRVLNKNGVFAIPINKVEQESPNILDLILDHHIDLVIDTPSRGEKSNDGFIIRRNAIETGVNVLTSMDTANALATAMENVQSSLTPVDIAAIG
ncbi:MAG: carbamoyl-phosphate synthase large subunit, partial [Lachnospiraceae bacterium]|nr:carbamoyl-phosphate synthase large subunit [Lachnospiraceae bacterium]